MTEKALLIAGPTASGKSALALKLARETGGVIVNADSMQVYRDLRILTARPTPEEEAEAPHRLYGTVDAAENFSVGRYLDAVAAILAAQTRPLIVVGGTGLYFKALTEGLSEIPAVSAETRARVRARWEAEAPEAMHGALARVDPVTAARLRPSDPQRLMRALEVFEETGRPLAFWQDQGRTAPLLPPGSWRGLFLSVDRATLRARIDARFEAMMAAGAMAEAEHLAARGLDPALPAMRAHGVPGLIAHLRGEMGLAEAVEKGKRDTRAYAKRQETWFRGQMAGWEMVGA